MSDQNVCPYCGCDFDVDADIHTDPYTGNKSTAYQAECPGCGASGPDYESTDKATIEFTHPAHLMATLHTYDPKTQIVISREAARRVAVTWFVDSPFSSADDDAALAELRAALEVKE